jgi:pimeloyl-ACP methyl ester carboxylesterase
MLRMVTSIAVNKIEIDGSTSVGIESRDELLGGRWVTPADVTGPPVLFVAGGGVSPAAEVFAGWQRDLATFGVPSLCFDFRGVGSSTGRRDSDSLAGRVLDTLAARALLAQLAGTSDCVFVGNSMGAHVAVRAAAAMTGVRALVLRGAAAYAERAEFCRFGPDFRAAIRTTDSWRDSPVFADLTVLQLPTLLLYSEYEQIVPAGVRQMFHQAAGGRCVTRIVPGVGHHYSTAPPALGRAAWQIAFGETRALLATRPAMEHR